MTKIVRSIPFKFDYQMFVSDIVAFHDAHDLRWHEIDKLAGLCSGNANNIVNGMKNSKVNTILALANAMDVDVRTYFVLDV